MVFRCWDLIRVSIFVGTTKLKSSNINSQCSLLGDATNAGYAELEEHDD